VSDCAAAAHFTTAHCRGGATGNAIFNMIYIVYKYMDAYTQGVVHEYKLIARGESGDRRRAEWCLVNE